LVIGDVVGKPGRRAIRTLVPPLRRELGLDLVIANGENSAGGFGITPETAQDLMDGEVDVITSGNHVWKHKELIPYVNEEEPPLIRPANYPPGTPGRGYIRLGDVMVMNLMGRVFMNPLDCPFRAADHILRETSESDPPRVVIVDFHAEATSEKQAMAWYLAGRVSAVVGTHTHVPTADPRVLPGGTAFVTDVGMTGPWDSIIGCEVQGVLEGLISQMPKRFTIPEGGPVVMNAVLVDIDRERGTATSIQRVDRTVP
jgi:metallophosphoesterase (TIGR00282 family)